MSHDSQLHGLAEQIIWLLTVPLLAYFFSVAGTRIDFEVIQIGALSVGALGVSCIVAVHLAALVARFNRTALVWSFTPLTFAVLIGMGLATIGQVSLLAALAVSMKLVNSGILMFLAALTFGAFCACETLWEAVTKLRHQGVGLVVGHELTREASPKLFAAIDDIAERLGTVAPDSVLINHEPQFSIFTWPTRLPGSESIGNGSKLLISALLMRALTVDEFRAILAHELAHYRGKDLDYGRRFLPIYCRLRRTVAELSDTRMVGLARLGRMPALVALKACLLAFAKVERHFSRERELVADRASVDVVGKLPMACALVKCSLSEPMWRAIRDTQIDQLKQGRFCSRLAAAFDELCSRAFNEMDLLRTLQSLRNNQQPHPFDTHPTLESRIENLGMNLFELSKDQLKPPVHNSSSELLEDHDALDQTLSSLDADALVALGYVELPRSQDLPAIEQPQGQASEAQ